jgi:hypothetical protein
MKYNAIWYFIKKKSFMKCFKKMKKFEQLMEAPRNSFSNKTKIKDPTFYIKVA